MHALYRYVRKYKDHLDITIYNEIDVTFPDRVRDGKRTRRVFRVQIVVQ